MNDTTKQILAECEAVKKANGDSDYDIVIRACFGDFAAKVLPGMMEALEKIESGALFAMEGAMMPEFENLSELCGKAQTALAALETAWKEAQQ